MVYLKGENPETVADSLWNERGGSQGPLAVVRPSTLVELWDCSESGEKVGRTREVFQNQSATSLVIS